MKTPIDTESILEMESDDITKRPSDNSVEQIDKSELEWQKSRRYYEDTRHRGRLTRWVMWVVSLWLALVLLLVLLAGTRIISLSETVLVALLATTTANILGLAYIVLKGMFPEGK
jgi:hypothetical protein